MTLAVARVTVTTSATLILHGGGDGSHANIRNSDGVVSVILGGSTVTATTGYTLAPATAIDIDLGPGEALYGIVAAGTVSVHLLSTGG